MKFLITRLQHPYQNFLLLLFILFSAFINSFQPDIYVMTGHDIGGYSFEIDFLNSCFMLFIFIVAIALFLNSFLFKNTLIVFLSLLITTAINIVCFLLLYFYGYNLLNIELISKIYCNDKVIVTEYKVRDGSFDDYYSIKQIKVFPGLLKDSLDKVVDGCRFLR